MPMILSLYLDLARFSAALVVVLSHAWMILFPGHPLHWPGPPAVIVFFVLSGFVIAYVTDGRDRTLADYTLNRLSRLWSVALPALAFGAILFPFVGRSAFSPGPADGGATLRSAANALFLGQVWFLDAAPPLNGPFWSLNYEAWFYAIFGAWVYLPRPARLPASCVLAVLAGPKILLLLPCWLLGTAAYRSLGRWDVSETAAAALWAGSLGAALLLVKSALATTLHEAFQARWPHAASMLAYSGYPLTDYPLATLVALNFFAVGHLRRIGRVLLLFARPIRTCASYTLTTYLFHLPLLVLFWDVLHIPAWLCVVALAASIIVAGRLSEHRRLDLRVVLEVVAFRLGPRSRSSATTQPGAASDADGIKAPPAVSIGVGSRSLRHHTPPGQGLRCRAPP
jgi:peptidoglycan/LPS O-acetylase OafA/YrhL